MARPDIKTERDARVHAQILRSRQDESLPGRGSEMEYAYSPSTLSIGFRSGADEPYRIANTGDSMYGRAEQVRDWVSVGHACVPEFGSAFPGVMTRHPGSSADGVPPAYDTTNFVVDGLESANENSDYLGDGTYPPFRIFDIEAQEFVGPTFTTRAEAEAAIPQVVAQRDRHVDSNFVVDGRESANENSDYLGDGTYPPFRIFDIEAQAYVGPIFGTRVEAEAAIPQVVSELARQSLAHVSDAIESPEDVASEVPR